MTEERQVSTDDQQASNRTGRREALKQMGQYAAYTAPTLIALTLPQQASAGRRKAFKSRKRRPRPHVSRG